MDKNVNTAAAAIVAFFKVGEIPCFYSGIWAEVAKATGFAPNNTTFCAARDRVEFYQSGDGTIQCHFEA